MEQQRHQSSASEETLISLQQLDPSPIDTPPEVDKQLPDLPSPPHPSKSTILGLSGSGHGVVYYLTRLQRYSSYAFTVYTTIHLTNTSIIPLFTQSVPAAESYLLLTRPYYQSPLLEPLLVTLPITIHVLSGFALRFHRRNQSLKRYGAANLPITKRLAAHVKVWPPLSRLSISGYVLAPLVLGHAFANRILPWWVEGGSSSVGLGFVSHGFAKHPAVAWVGYIALVGVGVGHFVWGMAKWQNWTPVGSEKKAKTRWWAINGISVLFTALWMVGGLGVVGRGGAADGWIGISYDTLYAKIPALLL